MALHKLILLCVLCLTASVVSGAGKAERDRRDPKLAASPPLASIAGSAVAGGPLLGHPDFYPSPARPIGWRGDGTGAWPGADVVTTWNAETGENIVWRSPMPAPSFAQPIVVGEKVFTMADPATLVCVNVHDGSILWQREIDHTSVMPPEQQAKAREAKRFVAKIRRLYGKWIADTKTLEAELAKRGKTLADAKVAAGTSTAPQSDTFDPFADDVGGLSSLAGNLSGIDPEHIEKCRELMTLEKQYGFVGGAKYDGIRIKPGRGQEPTPMMKRLHAIWRDYDLYVSDQWGEPWTTETFATPCSDGAAVYVATLNNAVARISLEGDIEWLVWEHLEERHKGFWNAGAIGTRFCPSLRLMDNKLVVNHNGELRVYDAATGKKLWSKYNVYNKENQFPWRPSPESVTPALTVLDLPDGGELALLADGGCNLYRLVDGFVVSSNMARVTWVSPILVDDLYCYRSSGPLVKAKRGVQRLKAVSRDHVAVEDIWGMATGGGAPGARCAMDAIHDGRIYLNCRSLDLLTGEGNMIADPVPEKIDTQNRSGIVVGGHYYALAWEEAWVFKLSGGKPIHIRHAFTDRRVNNEPEWQYRWGWHGNKNHSSPSAQANRLLSRSKGYLWCIGNPDEPFPVSESRPRERR